MFCLEMCSSQVRGWELCTPRVGWNHFRGGLVVGVVFRFQRSFFAIPFDILRGTQKALLLLKVVGYGSQITTLFGKCTVPIFHDVRERTAHPSRELHTAF